MSWRISKKAHFMAWERSESIIANWLKPRNEIQKSTLAGWVKIVLRKSGIDIS